MTNRPLSLRFVRGTTRHDPRNNTKLNEITRTSLVLILCGFVDRALVILLQQPARHLAEGLHNVNRRPHRLREMKALQPSLNDHDLAKLESDTFKYFLHEMHPTTGLVPDSTREGAPSSIAVVGFALTVYPIAVERGYLSRTEAINRTLTKLRFFYYGPDGE